MTSPTNPCQPAPLKLLNLRRSLNQHLYFTGRWVLTTSNNEEVFGKIKFSHIFIALSFGRLTPQSDLTTSRKLYCRVQRHRKSTSQRCPAMLWWELSFTLRFCSTGISGSIELSLEHRRRLSWGNCFSINLFWRHRSWSSSTLECRLWRCRNIRLKSARRNSFRLLPAHAFFGFQLRR